MSQQQFEQFKTVRVISREQFDSMKTDSVVANEKDHASPATPIPSSSAGEYSDMQTDHMFALMTVFSSSLWSYNINS